MNEEIETKLDRIHRLAFSIKTPSTFKRQKHRITHDEMAEMIMREITELKELLKAAEV